MCIVMEQKIDLLEFLQNNLIIKSILFNFLWNILDQEHLQTADANYHQIRDLNLKKELVSIQITIDNNYKYRNIRDYSKRNLNCV